MSQRKPVVVITGAAGGIGSALTAALKGDCTVVGLDRSEATDADDSITFDLTQDDSVELAMRKLRERHGDRIASVIHLAAYFDFTGEDSPLYDAVNLEGTRRLLRALRQFQVGQFVYSGTMLVHAPCRPGERIDESAPVAPKWAYPRSKAATEDVIREERGDMRVVLFHLAGLYDDRTAVPTLSHQIARIYERDPKSHLFAGNPYAGQSMVHKDDMIDAFRRAIDRRDELPEEVTLLVGEPEAMSYRALQKRLGELIHGESDWATLELPKPVARAGAAIEVAAEPVIPDSLDEGEKPFIRPFMVEMADDHYALDVSRAQALLGWTPRRKIADGLETLVEALLDDPAGWYDANGITPPRWLKIAEEQGVNGEAVRRRHEDEYRRQHARFLWAPFVNAGIGSWLIAAPSSLDYGSPALVYSDMLTGALVLVVSLLSLSWRFGWARWITAAAGIWLLFAPLVFWAPTAAAYLNGTVFGSLVIGFSVLVRPAPGISPVAAVTGPTAPPGWDRSPSNWFQRAVIIVLAMFGLYVSRHMAAYQLGHTGAVWDPFFTGGPGPKNGTEEIITSWASEAWPVSDAGLGAMTYLLEILVGMLGSSQRWRTMPWVVALFGFMIVPLGIVSITFIVIQPILLGTWCTLCLAGALAMLVQIPYSLDELVATGQFLVRRKRAGRSLLRIFFVGDTDEAGGRDDSANFSQSPLAVVREMLAGGVNLPWNLAVCCAIGVWLMFTRATLGNAEGMADADHLIGALVLTISVTAFAEVARPARFLNMACGAALLITPFAFGADAVATVASLVAGSLLIGLSVRRGPVHGRYGNWERFIV